MANPESDGWGRQSAAHGQRVIVDKLPGMFLDAGSEGIETTDTPCAGSEIEDKETVNVLPFL